VGSGHGRSIGLAILAGALASLLIVALTGAGGVAPASRTPRAAPAVDAAAACSLRPGRTVRVSVAVDGGGTRSALVHLPRKRRGRAPLVLALHGAYGSGSFMERYSGLSRLSDREGFVVVYPDSAGPLWRISVAQDGADVRFLDAVIDRMLESGCVDERRISAVGVSNGGGMAVRFACSGEDRLAGVVAVAGAYGQLPACRARRPLSVLEVHGTADRVVPYRGTPANPRTDVVRWLRDWARRDGCALTARRTRPRQGVLRLDWTPCRGGTSVAHLRLVGGAHAWPGADPPDPGPDLGVSASEEAWKFLRGRQLAPALDENDDG
jgi:polyhydroxybutyrate depolymerase